MCREYKLTIWLLIMQVVLQLFLDSNFTKMIHLSIVQS